MFEQACTTKYISHRVVTFMAGVFVDAFLGIFPYVLTAPWSFPNGWIVHREVVEQVPILSKCKPLNKMEVFIAPVETRVLPKIRGIYD